MGHSDSADASSDETEWYAWLFSMRGFELHPNPTFWGWSFIWHVNRWNVVPKPWISFLIQMTCTMEQRLGQATHRTQVMTCLVSAWYLCHWFISISAVEGFHWVRVVSHPWRLKSIISCFIWPFPSPYNWLGSNVHKILAPHLHTQWETWS